MIGKKCKGIIANDPYREFMDKAKREGRYEVLEGKELEVVKQRINIRAKIRRKKFAFSQKKNH
jgi:hypothetical protein